MSAHNHTVPSIALVYDRATVAHGGAEELLQFFHQAFPSAPLYTSVWNSAATWTKNWLIYPSWLQSLPLAKSFHRLFVPLMPLAFESLDLSGYDIIFSITSAEAKGVLTKPHQFHCSYIFTPTRYLYQYDAAYQTVAGWYQWPGIKQVAALIRRYLYWWDAIAVLRPDKLLTLSQKSAQNIASIYARSAQVVYPPANLPEITKTTSQLADLLEQQSYLLSVSRLVPYKQIDLAMQAAIEINKPLVIAGSGPDQSRLHSLLPSESLIRHPNESLHQFITRARHTKRLIWFCGTVTDTEKTNLISHAQAALMLGAEDFGLFALQTALAGIPTFINHDAGVAEVLKSQPHCLAISPESVITIKKALSKIHSMKTDKELLRKLQTETNPELFIRQIQKIVYDEWQKYMKKYDASKKGAE